MLTRGGGAELIHLADGDDVVWSSDDDEEFSEEFSEFLTREDVADILDYLEEVGELTRHEADRCDIQEEYYSPSDFVGMF